MDGSWMRGPRLYNVLLLLLSIISPMRSDLVTFYFWQGYLTSYDIFLVFRREIEGQSYYATSISVSPETRVLVQKPP